MVLLEIDKIVVVGFFNGKKKLGWKYLVDVSLKINLCLNWIYLWNIVFLFVIFLLYVCLFVEFECYFKFFKLLFVDWF